MKIKFLVMTKTPVCVLFTNYNHTYVSQMFCMLLCVFLTALYCQNTAYPPAKKQNVVGGTLSLRYQGVKQHVFMC